MKRQAIRAVLLILISPAISSSQPGNIHTPPAEVQLMVRNFAEVPQQVLDSAGAHASAIFELAGVPLNWMACPTQGRADGTVCAQQPGPNQISVRLVRRPTDRKVQFAKNTGGAAIRAVPQGGSGYITIYYDRVEEIAERMRVHRQRVLAHALAHEIGHILLPPGSHSQTGIMRERLEPADWRAAAMGRLLFTLQQAQLMRAGMRALANAASAAMAAGLRPE